MLASERIKQQLLANGQQVAQMKIKLHKALERIDALQLQLGAKKQENAELVGICESLLGQIDG